MTEAYTRRHFLRLMAAGGAMLVTGCLPRSRSRITKQPGDGFLRFVFYTDIHARTEWDTPVALEMAARAINEQSPDIVISGGDMITDGFQSSMETVAPRWDAYMKMYQAIDADIYPIMGNHDLVAAIPEDGSPPAEDPRAVFRSKMGRDNTYYSFDAGGYHFIVLDSVFVTGGKLKYHGIIWPEQIEWIREELSGIAHDTPIVLMTHIPLLTAFYGATKGLTVPAPKNRVMVNNTEVLDLFTDHNLLLVLQGHLHVSEMLRWKDTTFITGGAICGRWWRGNWMGTEEGFTVMTLRGQEIDWEYVDYGWDPRRPKDR